MSNTQLQKKLSAIILKTLNLPKNFKINENMKNEDIAGLDSIAWINIVLEVSKELNIDFKVEKIAEIKDIKSFYKITEELYKK